MTGWNLPPGCSVNDLPGNQDYPCEICGQFEDNCICPECPECSAFGDPKCYIEHGLIRTAAQINSLAKRQAEWTEQLRRENEYWDDMARQEAEAEQYWNEVEQHNNEKE